ncbi:oligosaccharide flippase family protein [Nissabacter archeti]|uniref:oligosaccharide flippase family protein n=1 Tax=Nissabacter archeti TaxID=1917880 RepID=UPI0009342F72|nr:oligosaccharide flippase family protein [Nissabacter archeti]
MLIKLNNIARNAIWMMIEKVVAIFGLFFVTSYVARYIGPALFGELAFAMAIFQIVQVTAQMGSDNIIFKRTAKNVGSGVRLINGSFLLRLGLYVIVSTPILFYFYLQPSLISFLFAFAVCIAYLFSSLDVYAIYNNATLQSRVNTLSNMTGLATGLVVRYGIAWFELNPALLAVPIILTTAIPFIMRYRHFKRNSKAKELPVSVRNHAAHRYSHYLLMAGGAVVLSGISVSLYPRMNQFFISSVLGSYQLGIYSVALSLATSWSFVLTSVITSFYPSIYAEKNNRAALGQAAQLNWLILIVSGIITLIFFVTGEHLLSFLYGEAFKTAYVPMLILCLGTLFSSLGAVAYRFIIKYSGYRYLSVKTVVVLVLSLLTSYFLTRYYGLAGASLSFVLVEFFSLTLLNYFFNNGAILKMHLHTIGLGKWLK